MKLSDIKEGDTLIADGGFTCIRTGASRKVGRDRDGIYILCGDGRHYLEGQVSFDGKDEIAGLTKASCPVESI